jgi:hypothetical protein
MIDIVEEGRDVGVMLSDLGLGSHLVARPLISAEDHPVRLAGLSARAPAAAQRA